MKDEVPLGKLAPETATRDAVHIAVFPAIAGERLAPGERVGFISGDGLTVGSVDARDEVGIVDPFLTKNVKRGERIYVALFPNTITGMSHYWRHPAFDALPTQQQVAESTGKSSSQKWLADYCAQIGCRTDEIMDAAETYLATGEYWNEGARWEGVWLDEEFWEHYGILKGQYIPKEKRDSFFSCSC